MSLVTDAEWDDYKAKFNKIYTDENESYRRELYQKAKARIEEHNQKFEKGEVTWRMAINHLADATPEEMASRAGKKVPPPPPTRAS